MDGTLNKYTSNLKKSLAFLNFQMQLNLSFYSLVSVPSSNSLDPPPPRTKEVKQIQRQIHF